MDYRGVFCCKNSSVFRAEEFIFMVNFDEIEFLESEIVDDDPDAPVGTLVHISDNGNSEEVSPAPTQDVADEPIEQEPVQEPETVETAQDEPVGQVIDEKGADVQDETQDVKNVEEPVEEPTITNDEQNEETVDEVVEQTQEVETAKEPQAEDVQENVQDIATVDTVSEENVESVEERPVQNVAIEEPVEQVVQEAQQEQAAVEEPQQNVEEVNQEVASEEAVQGEVQEEVKPATPKKPRKKAVKKEEPAQDTAHVATSSINLKNGTNVNEALFDTSFEVEQPAKTKIVSTKKKQEKSEDLWAVAVVAKPAKTTAPKDAKAEEEKQEVEPKKVTAKKSTPKKSTKVENTQDNSTEEKKVAKATDKSTKDEAKTTKTAKATKTEPVKEEVKEEKAAKAKAPAKEEKAPKAKAVKEEVPAKETKATKTTAKADSDETVIVEGEGKMHGKYVIKKTDKGNFVFKLYSANFRVVAIGAQAYTTLGAAKIGVQSVINNAEKAPIENQTLKNYETLKFPKWEIYLDKKGEYRLRLYATNGSLIATTNDGYADISGAKNGIVAVGRASKGCAIVRNDNLW